LLATGENQMVTVEDLIAHLRTLPSNLVVPSSVLKNDVFSSLDKPDISENEKVTEKVVDILAQYGYDFDVG
jgi:hypothetical protein